MKKIWLIPLILTALLLLSLSCKNPVKKEESSSELFRLNPSETTVTWTAYKTSSKIGVPGVFEELIIDNSKEASSIMNAVDGLSFKIPVNSINSKDSIRDGKLLQSFFGAMLNTLNLSGSIELKDQNVGSILLKMNGVSQRIAMNYSISNDTLTMEGTMDVNNWAAQKALESLNDVCEELHKGPDGIPVTWSEVKVNVVSIF